VIIFTQKSIDTVKTGYQLRRRKEWKTIDRKVKRALYKNVDSEIGKLLVQRNKNWREMEVLAQDRKESNRIE
jgi:hypothetical protein